jgi:hypothetical protein
MSMTPTRPGSIITASTEPSFNSRHKIPKDKDKKRKAVVYISSEPTSSFAKTPTRKLLKKQKLRYDLTFDDDGQHDLTTQEGQMTMNPKMTIQEGATEARREYNRRNAARARKRNKLMVGDLQENVESLTNRVEDLIRLNDMLQTQLKVLQTQNRDLLVSHRDIERRAQAQSSNDVLLQLLQQLEQRNEAQQQVQTISQLLSGSIGLHDAFRTPN